MARKGYIIHDQQAVYYLTFTNGTWALTKYTPGSLSVTDGTDEDGIHTQAFTDLEGHVILKRQINGSTNNDTYYIYNYAGLLAYIVPPSAVANLGGHNLTTAPIMNLVFHFVYDTMGRLIEKTVPSKGTMYIVYDPLNRPVLMQDALMQAAHKWNYIKYDAKGRVASQGIYLDATRTTRAAMQAYVSPLSYSIWYESRINTLTSGGYYTIGNVFPTSATGTLTPLAFAYYDDYYLTMGSSPDFAYQKQTLTNEESPTTAPIKGVPTMVAKTTVGSGITTSMWLYTVIFYDRRSNPIQVLSNNHLYHPNDLTLTDIKTTVYNYSGVPQLSKVSKQNASGTGTSSVTTVLTTMAYDHMYRVTSISQQYNGGTTSQVAAYSYNEMGQVIKKGLGLVSGTTYLQNLDMRYNIRGQLLSINNSKLTSDGGATNNDSNDVFGMQLLYNQTDSKLGNTARYDGKLTGVKWMSKNGTGASSYERAFRYYYDGLNRDTAAIYAERTTTDTVAFSVTHGWDENRITYDPEGNIKTLSRNSTTQGSGTHAALDNLTYTYDTSSPNLLRSVADGSSNSGGFIGGGGGATYTYDGNGNLTSEPYKGISTIAYNVLNRTDKISFTVSANRYIDYTYNADGQLIRKRQYDNVGGVATLQTQTDYIDGFVYLTTTGSALLSYFPMPEGRVLYNGGTLVQEFVITDQQGNARVSFQNNAGTAQVKQENSYYPFGLIMPGSAVGADTPPNRQLYNGGSELQNDYGTLPDYYQTFYRNYDAALGRFVGVDPQAESAESMTGYQYAGNNPVMLNDPLGNLIALDKESHVNTGTDMGTPNAFADATSGYIGQNYAQEFGGGGFGGIPAFTSGWISWIPGATSTNLYSANGTGGGNNKSTLTALGIGTTYKPAADQSVTGKVNSDGPYLVGQKVTQTQDKDGNPTVTSNFAVAFKDPGLGYDSYAWIQTKNHNDEPYTLDMIAGSNNPPFYDEFSAFGPQNGHTSVFSDQATNYGPDFRFSANLTLVGFKGTQITAIVAFTWGFEINHAGVGSALPVTQSNTIQQAHQDIISNYNSTH